MRLLVLAYDTHMSCHWKLCFCTVLYSTCTLLEFQIKSTYTRTRSGWDIPASPCSVHGFQEHEIVNSTHSFMLNGKRRAGTGLSPSYLVIKVNQVSHGGKKNRMSANLYLEIAMETYPYNACCQETGLVGGEDEEMAAI